MKSYEELLAERDALMAAVAVLREYIERGSPVNFNPEKCERRKLLARVPQQCLAEIKADAVEKFSSALASCVGVPDASPTKIEYYKAAIRHVLQFASGYAASVRQGEQSGTWLRDENVNGGKRQGGE